jgi:hypothetical protein
MRITGLLAVLLFILILFFAASAASFAQSAASAQPAINVDPAYRFDRALGDLSSRDIFQLERNGVCYTLRTYVMAREDKDSDVTRMVRATRCLPAWKLEFKTAVAPSRRLEDDHSEQP